MEKAIKYSKGEHMEKIIDLDKEIHTFDEAAELTGSGCYHFLLLIVTGLSLSAVVAEGLSMSVVLPIVRCEFGMTNIQQGFVNAAAFTGIVFTSHFWGFLADTWGRRKVLTLALFTSFLFSMLSGFSISFEMLLICRLAVGLCIAGVQAAAVSYLGEFHCRKRKTKWVTYATMFLPFALIYVPALAILILNLDFQLTIFQFDYVPWRLQVQCLSVISAVTFFGFVFLPESPEFLLVMGKKDEALAVLQHVYKINTRKDKETFPVKELFIEVIGTNIVNVNGFKNKVRVVWNQTVPIFKGPNLENMLIMSLLIGVLYVVAHGTLMWLPMMMSLYLNKKHGTICEAVIEGLQELSNSTHKMHKQIMDAEKCLPPDSWTFQIMTLIAIAIIVSYLITAVLMNHVTRKYLLNVCLFIGAVSAFATVWGNNFYLNITLFILIMNSGNVASILIAVSAEFFPTNYKAMALCFIMVSGRIGAAAGSTLVGILLDYSCRGIFIFDGIIMISCIFICFYILNKRDKTIQMK